MPAPSSTVAAIAAEATTAATRAAAPTASMSTNASNESSESKQVSKTNLLLDSLMADLDRMIVDSSPTSANDRHDGSPSHDDNPGSGPLLTDVAVVASGFFEKLALSRSTGLPKWKDRFVVLSNSSVFVFRSNEQGERALSELPLGETAEVVAEPFVGTDADPQTPLYVLAVYSGVASASDESGDDRSRVKVWRLRSPSEEEIFSWLVAIQNVIEESARESPSSHKSKVPVAVHNDSVGRTPLHHQQVFQHPLSGPQGSSAAPMVYRHPGSSAELSLSKPVSSPNWPISPPPDQQSALSPTPEPFGRRIPPLALRSPLAQYPLYSSASPISPTDTAHLTSTATTASSLVLTPTSPTSASSPAPQLVTPLTRSSSLRKPSWAAGAHHHLHQAPPPPLPGKPAATDADADAAPEKVGVVFSAFGSAVASPLFTAVIPPPPARATGRSLSIDDQAVAAASARKATAAAGGGAGVFGRASATSNSSKSSGGSGSERKGIAAMDDVMTGGSFRRR
ncbi:hypothetical protein DFJ73DRAFT_892911 [Zopfochytrium polystomum]|nr:hypothetical protein DFJ73DRAFT_892911 [Zopfochytrium polystomum]